MPKPNLDVSPDAISLATRYAEWLVDRIEGSTGPFALNLSGGSTPKLLYELLATELYRLEIDWKRIHIFFGDERFVPMDHPDSNYKMAYDALISKVPIPEENVYPVDTTSETPEAAAAAYERTLKTYYGKTTIDLARPIFDVTLLGLGEDGHTASLFPGTPALREREKWVTSIIGAKPEPRISMTYPVLDSSKAVTFLIAGLAKRPILDRVLAGDTSLPATHITPVKDFLIFCDEGANGDT